MGVLRTDVQIPRAYPLCHASMVFESCSASAEQRKGELFLL